MKFKEKKTGNIVIAKTKPIIDSFKKDSRYEVFEDKKQEVVGNKNKEEK